MVAAEGSRHIPALPPPVPPVERNPPRDRDPPADSKNPAAQPTTTPPALVAHRHLVHFREGGYQEAVAVDNVVAVGTGQLDGYCRLVAVSQVRRRAAADGERRPDASRCRRRLAAVRRRLRVRVGAWGCARHAPASLTLLRCGSNWMCLPRHGSVPRPRVRPAAATPCGECE